MCALARSIAPQRAEKLVLNNHVHASAMHRPVELLNFISILMLHLESAQDRDVMETFLLVEADLQGTWFVHSDEMAVLKGSAVMKSPYQSKRDKWEGRRKEQQRETTCWLCTLAPWTTQMAKRRLESDCFKVKIIKNISSNIQEIRWNSIEFLNCHWR